MRYIILLLTIVSCILFSFNALAEDVGSKSLYKGGDAVASVGYSSLTESVGGLGVYGFTIGTKYFFTNNIGVGVEFNSVTIGGGPDATNINATFGYHAAFNENVGGYVALGYGTTTAAGVSATGIAYELGIESKFSSNVLGHLAYKNFSLSAGGGSASAAGVTIGIDFIF